MGRNTQVLKDFVKECIDYNTEVKGNKIGIFTIHPWGYHWIEESNKKARVLESVILEDKLVNDLMADIQ